MQCIITDTNNAFFLKLPFFQGATEVPKKHTDEVIEALGYMEGFLENNVYVAGYDVTIADLSLLATVSTLIVSIPILNHVKRFLLI